MIKVRILLFQVMYILNNTLILSKLLIGFRTGFNSLVINIFKYAYLRIGITDLFNFQIEITKRILFFFLFFLKKHSICLFNTLIDLTCFEFLNSKYNFNLIYYVLSFKQSLRFKIKVKLQNENKSLVSITSIFYNSGWLEREVFDFFGLYFLFNKDLRRILLDYGFKGYPLKKNFPLSGFIELYYDDSLKKIIYDKTELSQEYRFFLIK